MKTNQKVLLAAAAMTGLLAGASVRATPVAGSTTAKPAAAISVHHGVRVLDGPTSRPAGSGTGKSQNGCPSVSIIQK